MISRPALLFLGIVLVTLGWVFLQLWALYDRLGSPLLLLYSTLTVASLAAGIAVLALAALRRRRAPGGMA